MTNPADWLLDLISVDNRGGQEAVTRARVQAIVESWAARKTNDEPTTKADDPAQGDGTLESDEPASLLVALPVIVERMVKNMWRQKPGELSLRYLLDIRNLRPMTALLVFFVRMYQAPLVAV